MHLFEFFESMPALLNSKFQLSKKGFQFMPKKQKLLKARIFLKIKKFVTFELLVLAR